MVIKRVEDWALSLESAYQYLLAQRVGKGDQDDQSWDSLPVLCVGVIGYSGSKFNSIYLTLCSTSLPG